ncbi:tRNA pseudouridine synthase D TruD [Ferroglobus placidus DSM 10642]|uniref:Probable tRNA pseudouridine synthase D n=1 Tax=Ferroglobus placidus (strain DSM 10642 / AEDII12DO) TaxID=589924 RepID=D3S0F6_FERPA|nr:tRNA pseudouridine(13) synthase TruD [Ferroglobus placidus]ADC66219.1 tRNA pseudouridine synthase D TruD [Ferroglobus placidus DSM 10642]
MIEERVGIEEYITKTPGIGGRIKESAEDFYVEEIIDLEKFEEKEGKNLLIKVRKKNWETLNFARVLSNVLGISQKRVGYSGTKDKNAVSVQYFMIYNADERIAEKLKSVKLKDAEIEVVCFTSKNLELGDLIGNFFRVRVSDAENGERVEKITEELKEKGIPNFFGIQRFGSLRLITHEVGKLIIQRKYEDAFWVYVAKPFEGEREEVRRIREILWNERDAKFGLRELPKYLRYERLLLQKLREGKSELEALLSLPKNLKLMFIHAYQSYLFNRLLSERIREYGNLKEIERDDFVDFVNFRKGYKVYSEDFSILTEFNSPRVSFLKERGYAVLALPLPGYETKLIGWSGEKLKEILEEEEIDLESFKSEYPEFSSKGSLRVADIPFDFEKFFYSDGVFEFFLPKGCYATVFLREYMKSEQIGSS